MTVSSWKITSILWLPVNDCAFLEDIHLMTPNKWLCLLGRYQSDVSQWMTVSSTCAFYGCCILIVDLRRNLILKHFWSHHELLLQLMEGECVNVPRRAFTFSWPLMKEYIPFWWFFSRELIVTWLLTLCTTWHIMCCFAHTLQYQAVHDAFLNCGS